jgi:hypothetical protein
MGTVMSFLPYHLESLLLVRVGIKAWIFAVRAVGFGTNIIQQCLLSDWLGLLCFHRQPRGTSCDRKT